MCTLTVIERPDGYRVVVNRDEKRTRPAATPPATHLIGGIRALWPTDSLAGGTWIAANTRGVCLSVQNVSPTPPPALPADLVSRGAIIPRLIRARSAHGAISEFRAMRLSLHAPMRLVAIDASEIIAARWDRTALDVQSRELGPACFVTSGLGDCLATPRLGLWEMFLGEHGQTTAMQDDFHRHAWADRPEVSVMMSRADARTVSTTSVDVRFTAGAARISMAHRDDAGVHRAELHEPVVAAGLAAHAAASDDRAA